MRSPEKGRWDKVWGFTGVFGAGEGLAEARGGGGEEWQMPEGGW